MRYSVCTLAVGRATQEDTYTPSRAADHYDARPRGYRSASAEPRPRLSLVTGRESDLRAGSCLDLPRDHRRFDLSQLIVDLVQQCEPVEIHEPSCRFGCTGTRDRTASERRAEVCRHVLDERPRLSSDIDCLGLEVL